MFKCGFNKKKYFFCLVVPLRFDFFCAAVEFAIDGWMRFWGFLSEGRRVTVGGG